MSFRIHPENPKLFEFRGQPRVLVCATEHYGAVMNRPFDFEAYLRDAHKHGHTLTRLFTLFRELQTAINPYSTCKPESPDYIAPFMRVGPKRALDGEPQFDLSQWNPEFFDRLHRFLTHASELGIVVEVVLLSNTYADAVWTLNPLHPANNINGIEPRMELAEYMSLRHPSLWAWQSAHVRKIVEETNRYDNIFFEICNEPGGPHPGSPKSPGVDEVNEWQRAVAKVIRETEAKLPHRHLIAGQEAFTWSPQFIQTSDLTFSNDFPVDIVNMHPLPATTFGGVSYDMGNFMAKELKLSAVRDFALASYEQRKPLNYDEDNSSTQYKDDDAWRIHRKRAWTTLLSGGHYDMIDFSITIHTPAGTPASQRAIRTWIGHLSRFIHSIDLLRARPMRDFLKDQPAHTLASVLAIPGEDYCICLADSRELGEAGVGKPISGAIAFDLPAGTYEVSFYSPEAGVSSAASPLDSAGKHRVDLREFRHDVVVRVRRR